MTFRRLAVGITGLVLLVGCARSDRQLTGDALPPATRSTPDDLPPPVQIAFRRDYPDAAITGITPMSAETGSPLFRVTFINDRSPGSAIYYMNGQRLTLPSSAPR
jgi:hypothetical protein